MVDLLAVRRAYAVEIRAIAQLRDDALVEAFARVPREHFLGPGPWQIAAGQLQYETTADSDPRHVYRNVLIAIDATRSLNNGLPSALATWIECLGLSPGDSVVHVGCGTGYYTAILAEIVGPMGHVVAVEIDPDLAQRARVNLTYLPQVDVRAGDGSRIDPGAADAVFVNAGATHAQPIWLDCLRIDGRLLLPVTVAAGHGGMFLITRQSDGFAATCVSPVAIFSCVGARDPDLERELAGKRGSESRVRSLRRDVHERDDTCWLHTPDTCLSTLALDSAGG